MKLDWCVSKHAYYVYSCSDSRNRTFEQLWKESYHWFETGVKSFDKVSDSPNVALLNCNMGRLMRLCARGSMGPDAEFSTKEKHYYLKVRMSYESPTLYSNFYNMSYSTPQVNSS